MKKSILSLSLIFAINANAMVVSDPTLIANQLADNVKAYAQQIQSYAQQVQMYKQMIIDTLNFEKHLKALGVDMDEWRDIIGDIAGTIDEFQNLYNDLKNIPNDLKIGFEKMNKACSFLGTNVDGFSSAKSAVKQFNRQTNKCFRALNDDNAITKKLKELDKDLQKATSLEEIKKIQTQISNIQNARDFVKQEKNQEMLDKTLAIYDTFYGDSEDGEKGLKITSYEDRAKKLKDLASQMKKTKNEKQTTALTNTILLEMLQQNTEMQGIMINFSNALATQQAQSGSQKRLSEDSFDQKSVTYEFSDDLYKDVKKMETDEYGLPVFRLK